MKNCHEAMKISTLALHGPFGKPDAALTWHPLVLGPELAILSKPG